MKKIIFPIAFLKIKFYSWAFFVEIADWFISDQILVKEKKKPQEKKRIILKIA